MQTGIIKFFDTARGFGFVTPNDGGPDVFFHIRALKDRAAERDIVPGVAVEFEVELGQDRRLRARDVALVGEASAAA